MTSPHLTATGPTDANEWEALIESAPRHTDAYGRTILHVCTANDGRPIHCTLEYAWDRLLLERQHATQEAALSGRLGESAQIFAEHHARTTAATERSREAADQPIASTQPEH